MKQLLILFLCFFSVNIWSHPPERIGDNLIDDDFPVAGLGGVGAIVFDRDILIPSNKSHIYFQEGKKVREVNRAKAHCRVEALGVRGLIVREGDSFSVRDDAIRDGWSSYLPAFGKKRLYYDYIYFLVGDTGDKPGYIWFRCFSDAVKDSDDTNEEILAGQFHDIMNGWAHLSIKR